MGAWNVTPSGAATLTFEMNEFQVLDPSRGRYAQGDRDFTQIHEVTRRVWTGRYRREGGVIRVAFDRPANAMVRVGGYGEPTLPVLLCQMSEELFDLEPEVLIEGAYPPNRCHPNCRR